MIGSVLSKLFGRQYTLGELMNIDEERERKSYGCSVSLKKVYHQVKTESLLDKFKSFFLGRSTALVYYVIFKLSVTSQSGKTYEVIIRTDPDYDLTNWMSNRVQIYCGCPDFKYRSAYLLGKRGSLFLNDRTRNALGPATTEAPKSKTKTSLLCKHSYAALSWLLDNYQGIMRSAI